MTAIGIFHENFAQHGGAERVAESMAGIVSSGGCALHSRRTQQALSVYGGPWYSNHLDAGPPRP